MVNKQVFPRELKGSFYLRTPKSDKPSIIYLCGRIGNKQFKLTTGVKVYPQQWDSEKQLAYISCRISNIDNYNNEIANNRLTEIRNSFNQYKDYLCSGGLMEHPEQLLILKKYIYANNMKEVKKENALNWLEKNLVSDNTIKASTLKIYRSALNTFTNFLKETGLYPISFDQIDKALIKDYERYLFNKVINKKGDTMSTVSVRNSIISLLAIIKRGEAYSKIDMSISKLDKYDLPKAKVNNDNEIYLSETQIEAIYNLKLTKKRDTEIRDCFVLQCCTGQRFSDMPKFATGTKRDTPLGKCIEIVQTKTSKKVLIPLTFPIAIEILDRYKYNVPVYNDILVLKVIKEIGKQAGITEDHTQTIQRGKSVITETLPMYNFIGTHTARRSYITNMLKRNINSEVIMKVTGHSSLSSFLRYAKLTKEDAALVMLEETQTDKPQINIVGDIIREIKQALGDSNTDINKKLDELSNRLQRLENYIKPDKLSMIVQTATTYINTDIPVSGIIKFCKGLGCFTPYTESDLAKDSLEKRLKLES